jgi:hypothetical protein
LNWKTGGTACPVNDVMAKPASLISPTVGARFPSPMWVIAASLRRGFGRGGDVLAKIAEQAGFDFARCEAPCPFVKLEGINVPAGYDRL